MHFCADELMMLMAGLPFVGYAFAWLRFRFRRKKPTECCEHPHSHELGALPEKIK